MKHIATFDVGLSDGGSFTLRVVADAEVGAKDASVELSEDGRSIQLTILPKKIRRKKSKK